MEKIAPIEYDSQGRMKYNPDLHPNQGKPWNKEDEQYLIDWYNKTSIEEMSLALGRAEATIAAKVHYLRKKGKMGYGVCNKTHKSLRQNKENKTVMGKKRKYSDEFIDKVFNLKTLGNTHKQIALIVGLTADQVNGIVRCYKKSYPGTDQSTLYSHA